MFIEKRNAPEINDIVTIKLASGEEIVGRLTDRTLDTVTLGRPVQIILQQISSKQLGLGFQPVLGSVSDSSSMQFALTQLAIRPVRTSEEVCRNYIQATTGLMPATADQLPPGV